MTTPSQLSLVLGLWIAIVCAQAKAADPEISCQTNNSISSFTFKNNSAAVETGNWTCARGFRYTASARREEAGWIFMSPVEPGLNSQLAVYYIDFAKHSAQRIGDIPISSEPVEADRYISIQQQGGSIFMQGYRLTTTHVSTESESTELLFNGSVCISRPNRVFVIGIGNGECKRIRKASRKNPICLTHTNNETHITFIDACKQILEQYEPLIQKQNGD